MPDLRLQMDPISLEESKRIHSDIKRKQFLRDLDRDFPYLNSKAYLEKFGIQK